MAASSPTRVLYAQPTRSEPVLNPRDLAEGRYRPLWDFMTVSYNINYPYFTDVGDAVWRAATRLDPATTIALVQGGGEWEVRLVQPGLQVGLRSVPYKGLITGASNMAVSIVLAGEEERARRMARDVVLELGRYPWEMNDWSKFMEATGVSVDEAVGAWVSLLGEVPRVGAPEGPSGPTLMAYRRAIREVQAHLRGLEAAFPDEVLLEDLRRTSERIRVLFDDRMLERLQRAVDEVGDLLARRRRLRAEREDLEKRLGVNADKMVRPTHREAESMEGQMRLRLVDVRDELLDVEKRLAELSAPAPPKAAGEGPKGLNHT